MENNKKRYVKKNAKSVCPYCGDDDLQYFSNFNSDGYGIEISLICEVCGKESKLYLMMD